MYLVFIIPVKDSVDGLLKRVIWLMSRAHMFKGCLFNVYVSFNMNPISCTVHLLVKPGLYQDFS